MRKCYSRETDRGTKTRKAAQCDTYIYIHTYMRAQTSKVQNLVEVESMSLHETKRFVHVEKISTPFL